jgi:hypothetical protein
MNKNLLLIIGCDTDPILEKNDRIIDKKFIWEKTIHVIENVSRMRDSISNRALEAPKITWFLRSDWQTYKIWNDWCYPGRTYRSLWNDLERSKDEIGWHPHLWYLNESTNTWYQSFDESWISYCLDEGYKEISKLFDIMSVRMGWDFHSNYTMNKLKLYNIKYDLSALPGMKNEYLYHNNYDWENVATHPYHPSINNYKQGNKYLNNYELLEIPIMVIKSPFYFSVFQKNKFLKLNIAKHPIFINDIIKYIIGSNEKNQIVASYFHPSDVENSRGLFSYNNFCNNLKNLLERAQKRGLDVEFITPREINSYLSVSF